MRQAVYRKKPITHILPKSNTARRYHHLARRVHQGEYSRNIEDLEKENSFLKSILKGLGISFK